jgi:hypothetical protein
LSVGVTRTIFSRFCSWFYLETSHLEELSPLGTSEVSTSNRHAMLNGKSDFAVDSVESLGRLVQKNPHANKKRRGCCSVYLYVFSLLPLVFLTSRFTFKNILTKSAKIRLGDFEAKEKHTKKGEPNKEVKDNIRKSFLQVCNSRPSFAQTSVSITAPLSD